jgi:hypothetical protein
MYINDEELQPQQTCSVLKSIRAAADRTAGPGIGPIMGMSMGPGAMAGTFAAAVAANAAATMMRSMLEICTQSMTVEAAHVILHTLCNLRGKVLCEATW